MVPAGGLLHVTRSRVVAAMVCGRLVRERLLVVWRSILVVTIVAAGGQRPMGAMAGMGGRVGGRREVCDLGAGMGEAGAVVGQVATRNRTRIISNKPRATRSWACRLIAGAGRSRTLGRSFLGRFGYLGSLGSLGLSPGPGSIPYSPVQGVRVDEMVTVAVPDAVPGAVLTHAVGATRRSTADHEDAIGPAVAPVAFLDAAVLGSPSTVGAIGLGGKRCLRRPALGCAGGGGLGCCRARLVGGRGRGSGRGRGNGGRAVVVTVGRCGVGRRAAIGGLLVRHLGPRCATPAGVVARWWW